MRCVTTLALLHLLPCYLWTCSRSWSSVKVVILLCSFLLSYWLLVSENEQVITFYDSFFFLPLSPSSSLPPPTDFHFSAMIPNELQVVLGIQYSQSPHFFSVLHPYFLLLLVHRRLRHHHYITLCSSRFLVISHTFFVYTIVSFCFLLWYYWYYWYHITSADTSLLFLSYSLLCL